jgi:hypothetical protein
LKTKSKIWFWGIIAIAVLGLMLAVIIPSLPPGYEFHSVNDARLFGPIADAEIVGELGDTNGPFRLVKSTISGVGKPFDFDLMIDGSKTNWTQPVSNHMWFVVTFFENRKGNQFAVVRKRTE